MAGQDRVKCQEANALVRLTASLASLAASLGLGVLVEFPEDLGSTPLGTPASIWQLQEFKDIGNLTRGAIYQCAIAPIDYGKPTGLLTNLRGITADPRFHAGWPRMAQVKTDFWE